MSFSAKVKENLSKINRFDEKSLLAELAGYYVSGNMLEKEDMLEFVTENEFNIEHFYKILFNFQIEYEPERRGKFYIAQMKKNDLEKVIGDYKNIEGDIRKSIVKGVFLGAGSVNNPEKNYHLEILFQKKENSRFIQNLVSEFDINLKNIKVNDRYQLYLKEGEEISKFLALIGASTAVLQFEDVRVMKEMKNRVNRRVNCETANLNKTVEAALRQIDDIQLLKLNGILNQLPEKMQRIAKLRMDNPDLSLQDIGKLIEPVLSKSAVNRVFKKIHEKVENIRNTDGWKGV